MFEVVQHQEQAPLAQIGLELLRLGPATDQPQPQGGGDRGRDERRVRDGRERDKARAISEWFG